MRVVAACVMILCLAGVARTQERVARMELADGRVVSGPVLQLDAASITLDVQGRRLTYATAEVRHCRFSRPQRADGEPVAESHSVLPTPLQSPLDRARVATDDPTHPRRSPIERRLARIEGRFPWLEPTEPRQWVSLLVSLFALLSFALHLAVRLCAAERRGFGRSAGMSLALLVAVVVQLVLLPDGLVPLLLAMVGNGAALAYGMRKVYGLSLAPACVAVGLLALQGGALFFVLRVLDTALRALGGCPA